MKKILILACVFLSCEKEVNKPDCWLITFGITNGITRDPVTYCGDKIDTMSFRDPAGNYLSWSAEKMK